mmetsp:Transcript_27523/g.33422  ORF Transcript_27523/g.33422 Transcript_27523/m.33422 type:complete len:186 (-) Transcript_27523:35-592(-)
MFYQTATMGSVLRSWGRDIGGLLAMPFKGVYSFGGKCAARVSPEEWALFLPMILGSGAIYSNAKYYKEQIAELKKDLKDESERLQETEAAYKGLRAQYDSLSMAVREETESASWWRRPDIKKLQAALKGVQILVVSQGGVSCLDESGSEAVAAHHPPPPPSESIPAEELNVETIIRKPKTSVGMV